MRAPTVPSSTASRPIFASVNRGKESIALDLKADADRRVFEKLLEKADVVVENFRPGTMEKLGYGWDTLHAQVSQPDLRLSLGLRPYRPELQGPGLRHGHAGHGWRHEHHRQ
jgi:crotonobetainyl-CoA:carnitine CoA-transferase CaiB-like acyl-CoA transferase